MTLRRLLVLVDGQPTCTSRVRVAAQLAKDHGAHLIGIAPIDLVDVPVLLHSAATLKDLLALAKDALHDQAEQATDRFREQCHRAQVEQVSTIVDESAVISSLVRHAHCSDLAVLSQADPARSDHANAKALVEATILHSARPTLVVPYTGSFSGTFERVLVAWDDSREATRAISDSLPLLQRAREVTLIGWDEHPDDEPIEPRLRAIQAWLTAHCVAADTRAETSSIDIADAMLSRAVDFGTDLIVMGAYGHPRLSELVLGGATRGVLASMTIPVLMSH
jgi:nucleotide-binding universal stress UspA family protein